MKIKYYQFVFLLFCSVVSLAQNKSIEIGIEPGLYRNTISGSNGFSSLHQVPLIAFGAGGFILVRAKNNFGIKLKLAFEQNGWINDNLTFPSMNDGDVYHKLNYLNLPLTANYSLGKKIKFYIDGGVFTAFLLNSKSIIKYHNNAIPNEVLTTNSFKPVNFGLTIGAGIRLPISEKINLNVGVQNNLGLANIYKSNLSAPSGSVRTNAMYFLLGLNYQFKK